MNWKELPAANRRWLVVNAILVTAVINLVVNWLVAKGAVGDRHSVPMWGVPLVEPSVFWDLIGTLYVLPLVTSGVITALVRRDIRRGALARLDQGLGSGGRVGGGASGWRRGAELGVVAVFSVAPPLLLILAVLGFPELSESQFVAWHTGFAVALGIVVTPLLAILAMAEPE